LRERKGRKKVKKKNVIFSISLQLFFGIKQGLNKLIIQHVMFKSLFIAGIRKETLERQNGQPIRVTKM
jgi:hypothetical protein